MELTLNQLSKQYGKQMALRPLNATFQPGIYGLLGANGAGKTTLMRLICDILPPTSGEITLDGISIRTLGANYRALLGYLPQNFGYYPGFTATRFLQYFATLKGLEAGFAKRRVQELLDLVGLKEAAHQKIRTFSGGMRQRLGIAQALLNDPKVLILDEPTAGLDPKERVRFRNLIASFAQDKIVLLSTHIVTDVEYIADRLMILKDGTLIRRGTPQEILAEIAGCVWECHVTRQEASELAQHFPICNQRGEGDTVILRIVSPQMPCPGALTATPCLEDLYLYHFYGEGH